MNTQPDASPPGFVESWIELVRRRWLAALAVFLAVTALAAAMVFLSHPVYRAESRLRLGEPPPMTGVGPTTGVLGFMRLGGDPFANDMELLASRSLAEAVVEDAGLALSLEAPRGWHRDSVFEHLRVTRATERARYDVVWRDDGRIRIRQRAPRDSVVGDVAPGELIAFGGLEAVFRGPAPGGPDRIRLATLPFGEAVGRAGRRIRAERTRRDANVLELAFDDTDPAVAQAAVASTLARFAEQRSAIQARESGENVDSLQAVSARTMTELRAAEAALESFQRASRLVSPEVQGEAFVERYSAAVGTLAMARMELDALRSILGRADGAATAAEAWTEVVAYPRFLENEAVSGLHARLIELESRRQALAVRRTESHPELQQVMDEIAYLDGTLRTLAAAHARALAEQVDRLAGQVVDLESALAAVPADVIELGRRQRDVRVLSEVLVITEQRLRHEELRQALTFSNVQVIDPPALRYRPVWPRKKLGMAVGLLLAGIFAGLGMVVAERADRSVRRAADVRAATGRPVLATALSPRRGRPSVVAQDAWAVLRQASPSVNGGPALVVAPVDGGDAAGELVQALRASETAGRDGATAGGQHGTPVEAGSAPQVAAVMPVDSYAAALEAAAAGVPIALVVRAGRTPRGALRRAASFLAEAGGELAGTIVVCRGARERKALWD